MDNSKKWWQSKAVWGGLIAAGSAVAGLLFDVYIDEATQAQVVDLVLVVAGGAGGLLAIFGRIKANKGIK